MDLSEPARWILDFVATRVIGRAVFAMRRLRASPTELLLRPRRGSDIRVVLTSVPVSTGGARDPRQREFNYLAGLNEVQFAWTLRDVFQRLVPPRCRLLPIAYSKEMFVQGGSTVSTANREMWTANLIVSGSTKFNDATKDIHDPKSGIPMQLTFPPAGGFIVDQRTGQRHRTERRPNKEITADYGILARYWNLYDPLKTIVLIAGVESVFQLGMTRTLAAPDASKQLLNDLKERMGGFLPDYYEALIRIPGLGLESIGSAEVLAAYPIESPEGPRPPADPEPTSSPSA
jgi:hypothetical protein